MKNAEVTNINIHNSESRIADPSPKNQLEMQPCKLNVSKSKPNITLKKIEQELDIAETKCLTLKSELNYMMGVYREAETKENKGTFDISREQIVSSCKDPKSPMEHQNRNNEITDPFHSNPIANQFSPAKDCRNDDVTKKSEDTSLKEEKQKRLLNVIITPRNESDNNHSSLVTTMPVQSSKISKVRGYKSLLSRSPEHLRSMLSIERSVEKLTSQAEKDCFSTVKPELNLDASGPDITQEKNKYTSGMQKNEANFTSKASDFIFKEEKKTRKRRGKLRSSVSKSTIATKDTNLTGRREAKRRRHRGIVRQPSVFLKHRKRSNDVVEIFHNTTLKNSNSGVSGKHFKFDRETKYAKNPHFTETNHHKTQEKSCSERANYEHQSCSKETQQSRHLQALDNPNKSGKSPERIQEQNKLEKHSNSSPLQRKTNQCEHAVISRYNDPIFTPSYGMPTLSSKLKRSDRSYFNRFNFRSIPFVVGTSVTPSHNLGLNIQQVLSVMKTRHSMTNDVTPLLIRKVSKGMNPASSLLQQMNRHCAKSILDLNSQLTGLLNNTESLNVSRDKKSSTLELQYAEKVQSAHLPDFADATVTSEEVCQKIKQRFLADKSNTPGKAKERQEISKMSNKKDNIRDHKSHIIGSHNSKEIRDVLINLHDQFEEMNTKYEKLQSEIEKSNNDKALAKELSIMERELSTKEEEINAVIGLYKEVMTLKQQMNMLHEKNSFVYVATESSMRSGKNSFPLTIIPGRSRLMNTTQILDQKKGNAYGATREPPSSMQLAALLRQIQTFHKQLQLL